MDTLKLLFQAFPMTLLMLVEVPKLSIGKRVSQKAFKDALIAQGVPSRVMERLCKDYAGIQRSLTDNFIKGL